MKKKHVGRPSNKELREKKNKLILTVAISVVFVLLVVGVFETGSISILMGDSVTGYSCEDGYQLKGDKCTKTVRERAYKIGDVSKDKRLNVSDFEMIQRYLAEYINLDDYQILLADVNQDGVANMIDATLLQKYLSGMTSGSMSSEQHIGEAICPNGYRLNGAYCYMDITIDAMRE